MLCSLQKQCVMFDRNMQTDKEAGFLLWQATHFMKVWGHQVVLILFKHEWTLMIARKVKESILKTCCMDSGNEQICKLQVKMLRHAITSGVVLWNGNGRSGGPTWGLSGLTSADCQSPWHSVTDSCAWRKDKPQINTPSKNTGRNLRQRSCNVYRRRYAHATQAFFFG